VDLMLSNAQLSNSKLVPLIREFVLNSFLLLLLPSTRAPFFLASSFVFVSFFLRLCCSVVSALLFLRP